MRVLLSLFGVLTLADFGASIAPLPTGQSRCEGLEFDLERLQSISDAEHAEFGGSKSYQLRLASANQRTSTCRLRLTEESNGVPIYGATTVATVTDCTSTERFSAQGLTQEGLDEYSFQDVTGKTYSYINVARGYQPKYSTEEVKSFLAESYAIQEEGSIKKMDDIELYIFPTKTEDYLAYFAKLVVGKGADTKVIRVIVDAHDLTILSTCLLSSDSGARRRLRQEETNDGRRLQSLCSTCATQQSIASYGNTTTIQPHTLYLNDIGREAIVTEATLFDTSTILATYTVNDYYYLGTEHCFSDDFFCYIVELPTACDDAISDVHYVAVETLKYAQEQLDILGGLTISSTFPEYLTGFAHVDFEYCNAYYFANQIVFGDCDCSRWSPLVSTDVVSHEVAHGFTRYSSDLEYSGQSGGLNEAYSDIMGVLLEYYLHDSMDTPDFLVGEALQGTFGILRYMEDPPQDGNSIGHVCDYSTGLDVHYSSGILNKAFVKSVRACTADACSSSLEECVFLMGNLNFYTNINRLSVFSDFLDSAFATCDAVNSYLSELSPTTSCSSAKIKSFVSEGWSTVGITVDADTCTATNPTCPCGFCFSHVASVPVQNKGPTLMTDLVPGDKVLTANGYQTMYAMVHQNDGKQSAEFLQIYTDKTPNKPLEITGGHMVVLVDKAHPVPAFAVRRGDVLKSTEWPEGMRVTDVKSVYRSGLYAPMTTDGTVVVDGVVASCYVALAENKGEYLHLQGGISSGLSQHFFAHLSLAPVRMACIGISMNLCQAYDDDGMAYFARLGFTLVDIWDALPLPVQIVLLATFVLVCSILLALESVFGPKMSVFVIIGLMVAAAALRGFRKFGTKGESIPKSKTD